MNDDNAISLRRMKPLGALLAAAAMISLAACSSGDDEASADAEAPAATETASAAVPAGNEAPAAAPAAASAPAASAPASAPAPIAGWTDFAPAAEAPAASAPAASAPAASAPAASAPAEVLTDAIVEVRQLADWYYAGLIDEAAITDIAQLEPIARSFCPETGVCQVGLWYDADRFPDALPIGGTQLREEVFGFGRNDAGVEFALWNCNRFPDLDLRKCLPRAVN